ncbi:MAG: hypothetical protein ABIK65_06955 [Candidatus Eisenbacteria bacterium]
MKRYMAIAAVTALAASAYAFQVGPPAKTIHSPHDVHEENAVECEVCHEGAYSSMAGTDNLLPGMDVCAGCHDVEDTAACGQCHVDQAAPATTPRHTMVAGFFPHRTHVEKGMACAACHGDPAKDPAIPEKLMCRGCHETAAGYEDCGVCHDPSESLLPLTHQGEWLWYHGADAGVEQETCFGCHTQAGCQECHNGDNVRPRTHGLDYAFRHALDARGNEFDCASCHEERAFCVSCHAAERVMPGNHSRADWVHGREGGEHAVEGRFDLESCTACHADGGGSPVCADCHGR